MQIILKNIDAVRKPSKRSKSGIYIRCKSCNKLFLRQHETVDHVRGLCDVCNYNIRPLTESL